MKFTFLLLDILSKVCRVHLRIVGRAWFSLKQGHLSKILFARLLCRWLISYHENNEFVLFRLFNSSNIQTIILTYQARLTCRKITFPCLIFHYSSHIWKSDSAYVIQFALAKKCLSPRSSLIFENFEVNFSNLVPNSSHIPSKGAGAFHSASQSKEG